MPRFLHPSELLSPGDSVEVRIVRIDSANHRLGLSMRQVSSATPDAMTRKKESGPRPSRAGQRPTATSASTQSFWQLLLQREIWGLISTAAGAISVIALVSRTQGKLSEAWALLLRQMFGIGAYLIAFLLVAGGIVLLFWNSLQKWIHPRWLGHRRRRARLFCGAGAAARCRRWLSFGVG